MVEFNKEQFCSMPQDRKDEFLFNNLCGTETALKELSSKVDLLLKSPWRLALPPVSWKAIGTFIIILAFILRGDADKAFKLIALIFGIGG